MQKGSLLIKIRDAAFHLFDRQEHFINKYKSTARTVSNDNIKRKILKTELNL